MNLIMNKSIKIVILNYKIFVFFRKLFLKGIDKGNIAGVEI